jgi:hypothetical protein
MAFLSGLNDVLFFWHGVDGDTRTFWAEMGPIMTDTSPTSPKGIETRPNQVLDASSFAPPAIDQSAHILATVGPTAPSAIRLRTIGNPVSFGSGPAVPASFQTTARPAVAGNVVLAWQRPGDGVICVAVENGGAWSNPSELASSGHGPAVAVGIHQYLVAFQGANNQIYGSLNGGAPAPMRPQSGAMLTSDSPALLWWENTFWMAWKGVPGDNGIWLAGSTDGMNWSTPQLAQPVGGAILTAAGPGLALWKEGLLLSWRGVPGDEKLWGSTQPLGNLAARWQTPQILSPANNSNAGPSVGSREIDTL